MTRIQTTTKMILAAALIATGVGVSAGQNAGEVALRAAIERQTLAGDVRGAMVTYRELAAGEDRSVAAQAARLSLIETDRLTSRMSCLPILCPGPPSGS